MAKKAKKKKSKSERILDRIDGFKKQAEEAKTQREKTVNEDDWLKQFEK